ncbi:MAG TPA: hypothetical protein VEA80_06605 [Vitreimonas sp.]|uniref:hypothetical protein n=1 Tax=Vitreimonas sp. TaxID=3069702 RepID=UPI002D6B27B4|nr:hypothetical protein [Vitreimonas sp.]HYD87124.1 hypothetical protein [Vitreimonas sp.]
MKRVAFAELADISPAMVTKYGEQGLLVFIDAKNLDARASLEALAGRLDETKRQAALAKLDAVEKIAANDTTQPPPAPRAPPPSGKTAKVEIEELKRDTLQLELARKAGDLVPIEEVERTILDAIAGLQAAFDLEARAMAGQLTIDLGLSPDREAMLARRLRTLCNKARQRFAADMMRLAGGDFVRETDVDAEDGDAEARGA